MPKHRKAYSARKSRRTTRRVREQTVGTHVAREGQSERRRPVSARAESMARRARIRRIAAIVGIVAAVVAVAVGAGFMAFRGAVGGALSLKGSDASDALVAVKTGEPSYALVTVELGAVAEPLDNGGPDVVLLARLDPESGTLALVNVPVGLQITTDNRSDSLDSIADSGDAALIGALSTFAKIDISHIVKIAGADDVAGLVDALGGIEVDVPQTVDDPHAGSVVIAQGRQVLDGEEALVFLRATNLEYGAEDRLDNQLDFAAAVVESLFSGSGSFAARLDAVGPFIQTDYALSDLEALESWLGGVGAGDIQRAVLPGYYMAVTNVDSAAGSRYVSTSSEVAELVADLENGSDISSIGVDDVSTVAPSSFTVEVQNGTSVEGAASAAADELKAAGFKVGDVGNAEQPVFDETLVVYKGSDAQGLSRAKTVIEAYGLGRAVDGSAYYSFDADVLLIIGADNKPVA